MARNVAREIIMPNSASEPPTRLPVTYKGRKIDSSPNAISCRKKPSSHMATKPLQERRKTFRSVSLSFFLLYV